MTRQTIMSGQVVVCVFVFACIPTRAADLGAIWFIGDSIAQSNLDGDSSGSPRKSLYDLLVADGHTFTYTGHYTANRDGLPTTGSTAADNLYHYHSGISGSVIGDNYSGRVGMTQNMAAFWASGRLTVVKPNIILIMLGTNDVDNSIDLPNASARLKAMVQAIYDLPGVGSPTIFLASIPPNRQNATVAANVIDFNEHVPGVVSDFQAEGKAIRYVDQFSPLNDNYSILMRPDNLHPNAAGNDVMAQVWYEKMLLPIASVNAEPVSGLVPLTVEFDASASTASSEIVSYNWDFGDGTMGSGVSVQHTYADPGIYLATLSITTASGQNDAVSVQIETTDYICDDEAYAEIEAYDYNGDCRINLEDFAMLASKWLHTARRDP